MDIDTSHKLLRETLRIRMVEQRLAELYTEYEMRCPTHFSIGQEAVAVGVCSHLKKDELITSAHRSHAHYLAKGGNLKAMVAELYGKASGCSSGKGGSMHLIDLNVGFLGAVPVVGSTIPIGVGAAFSSILKKKPKLSVVFFGDAATETGVFYESMNFAAIHKLPVVMICENNLYSVLSSFKERRPSNVELCQIPSGFGILSEKGDGNDLNEVYNLTQMAVNYARSGKGPVFLEFSTYRWLEHCGPLGDEHLGYRSKEEIESWKEKDPVLKYKEQLMQDNKLTEETFQQWQKEISEEIQSAVEFAKTDSFPSREELTQHLYAE